MSRRDQDRDWEKGQAEKVQHLRKVLLLLLPEAERRASRPGRGGSRGEEPVTFEDHARRRANEGDVVLGDALRQYVDALNELWVYAERNGITERGARSWFATRRKAARGCDPIEVGAEATFIMRRICATYRGEPASLETYAGRALALALDDWLSAQRVPVRVPRDKARTGAFERVQLADLDRETYGSAVDAQEESSDD